VIPIDADDLLRIWEDRRRNLRADIARTAGRGAPLDDLMQDLFLKVYRRRERILPERAVPYLRQAATNLGRDYQRMTYRRFPYQGEMPEEIVSEEADPETQYAQSERSKRFYETVLPVIEGLGAEKIQALEAFVSDLPRSRAAEELGVNYNTLRNRELSALQELRETLAGYDANPSGGYRS
jgi:RNA polymerase sigma factor (sigma-70 family)